MDPDLTSAFEVGFYVTSTYLLGLLIEVLSITRAPCFRPGASKQIQAANFVQCTPTMATPKGAAAYKKKDGIITVTPDHKTVTWTATGSTTPGASIAIADIASESKRQPLRYLADTLPRSAADARLGGQGDAKN